MDDRLRPVVPGMILGVIGLIFGIFWAVYLVLGHEGIHKSFESRRAATLGAAVVAVPAAGGVAAEAKRASGLSHGPSDSAGGPSGGSVHEHGSKTHKGPAGGEVGGQRHSHGGEGEHKAVMAEHHGGHDDELLDEAHERLTRGHIHEMGLGVLTIALSVVLAFTGAPNMIKIIGSLLLGFGGLLYPFAWIVAGYRTVAMGAEAAQASTMPIVVASVPLVLLGLFITLYCLVSGFLKRR